MERKKFKYWFEENILSDTKNIVLFLLVCTLLFSGITSLLMFIIEHIFTGENDNLFLYYCDNLFTTINAWYPEIPDGEGLITWRIYVLKVVVALFGIFITSIVIGLVSEKIASIFENIRNNNRKVCENNHYIVLGYTFGECKVIEEIIASTCGNITILVADSHNKKNVYEDIIGHINIPKSVKLIVQSIDITDYNMLEYCSIESCKVVIVNILEDTKTMKTVLAASHIISKYNSKNVKIASMVRNDEHILPYNKQTGIITMVNASNFLVRFLAKTVNQKLLYEVLSQLLSFKGSEFYLQRIPEFIGKNVGYIYKNFSNAILVGIVKENKCVLSLDKNYVIEAEDSIIYISDYINAYKIIENEKCELCEDNTDSIIKETKRQNILIIGYCDGYAKLIKELCFDNICVIGKNEIEQNAITEASKKMDSISVFNNVLLNRNNIEKIVFENKYDKILLLSNIGKDEKNKDIETMLIALHLRDIRRLNNLDYQLITTLNEDKNRELIDIDEFNTIVISNNIIYMFLAQIAINNKLIPFFKDILSNDGIIIDILDINDKAREKGSVSVATLRNILLNEQCIYIGHVNKDNGDIVFDLNLTSKIDISKGNVALIVLKMKNA